MFKIINISKEVRSLLTNVEKSLFHTTMNSLLIGCLLESIIDENKATSRESHFCSLMC